MTDAQGTMPTTGRWGWYKDHEGREFRRVSTMVKKVETDRDALDKWFRRSVAVGLAARDDLVTAVKAVGRPGPEGFTKEQKKTLNEIADKALEAAKDKDGGVLGTAVHTLTERYDRGEDLEAICAGLPTTYAMGLRAYAKLLQLNKWQVVEIERTVVCDELEVAGTFDRIYEIPGLTDLLGEWICQHGHNHDMGNSSVIGDVKTEEHPEMNGLHIGPQLATYSRARRMWLPTGYVDTPCVRQDVAVVVHIRDGQAEPLFVDLAEGWQAARAAYEQTMRESRSRRKLGQAGAWFVPIPNIVRPKIAETFVDQAVAADYANPARPASAPSLATALLDAAQAGDLPGTMAAMQRAEQAAEQVAVSVGDGMIGWAPAPASGTLDDIDKSAIENVWAATSLEHLGETWRIYTQVCGRTWGGRVAEAADARRRQIECPQRQLHTAGKCSCGWTQEVPA